MNLKQLLLITGIQIALVFAIYLPSMPDFIQTLVHGEGFYDSNLSKVYGIIFKWGIVTMLILSMVFVGTRTKNELKFILFSELFLAVIFYKLYDSSNLILTLAFLFISLIIFLLRIPLRKLIISNNILA